MRYTITVTCFFFFNDTATTEIYTLSLHDALPILAVALRLDDSVNPRGEGSHELSHVLTRALAGQLALGVEEDRKSTRLNSSHANISYAVFCLKKKKTMYSHLINIIFRLALPLLYS